LLGGELAAGQAHRDDRVGALGTARRRDVCTGAHTLGHTPGAVAGGPGRGKTSFLELLVETNVGRMPVVIVDPKGSPSLESAIRAHGSVAWKLGGQLLLLGLEKYSAGARAKEMLPTSALCVQDGQSRVKVRRWTQR
jgi:hypothetical protein